MDRRPFACASVEQNGGPGGASKSRITMEAEFEGHLSPIRGHPTWVWAGLGRVHVERGRCPGLNRAHKRPGMRHTWPRQDKARREVAPNRQASATTWLRDRVNERVPKGGPKGVIHPGITRVYGPVRRRSLVSTLCTLKAKGKRSGIKSGGRPTNWYCLGDPGPTYFDADFSALKEPLPADPAGAGRAGQKLEDAPNRARPVASRRAASIERMERNEMAEFRGPLLVWWTIGASPRPGLA